MPNQKKFNRAMDPRKFLTGARRNTTLPPQKALDILKQLEQRAVKVDARSLKETTSLTAMELRAISDAIRLTSVRVNMMKNDDAA